MSSVSYLFSDDTLTKISETSAFNGCGVFTSFWVNQNVEILGWSLHVERIQQGASFYKWKIFSADFLKHELLNALKLYGSFQWLRVRLEQKYSKIRVILIEGKPSKSPPITLVPVEGTRSLSQIKSFKGARDSKYFQSKISNYGLNHEALLFSRSQGIIEGAWSSFGWIDETQKVYLLKKGLPSVTVSLLHHYKIGQLTQENIFIDDFKNKECSFFILSSIRSLIPVSEIKGAASSSNLNTVINLQDRFYNLTYTSNLGTIS